MKKYIPCIIVLAILVDLWFVGYKINKTHELVDLRQKDEIVQFFEKQTGVYRVAFLPPLNGTNIYAVHGIESVGGYHAAKLKIYQENFLEKKMTLYALNILNTSFIVSKDEIDNINLSLAGKAGGMLIYKNTHALSRYFLESKGKIQVLDRGIEHAKMRVNIETPNRLIFSEIYYPAWKVYVDGKEVENEIWQDLLCSVPLEAGEHLVELKYTSTYFNVGVLVCFLSVGIIGFLIIKRIK